MVQACKFLASCSVKRKNEGLEVKSHKIVGTFSVNPHLRLYLKLNLYYKTKKTALSR